MGECGGICRHCDSGARSERAVRSDESSNSNSSSGLDRARPWGDVRLPLLHDLFVRIPLVGFIAYCRYLPTSWEFSFAVLAAFALDDALDADAVALFHCYTISVCVVAAVVSLSLIMCGEAIQALLAAHPDYNPWLFRSLEFGIWVLIAIVVAIQPPTPRALVATVIALVFVESASNFLLPTLAYPRSATLDMAAIRFLQQNLGRERFYTLGPISPNYGSFYGIASINYNDLPVPDEWLKFVHRRLDRYSDPINFVGYRPAPGPGVPSRGGELKATCSALRPRV